MLTQKAKISAKENITGFLIEGYFFPARAMALFYELPVATPAI